MLPAPAQPSRHAMLALTGALWLCAIAVCWALLATPALGDYTGLMNLTESYGSLERVALWQRLFSWLPGDDRGQAVAIWPKPAIVWTVRAALTAMFALHALAFALAWRSRVDRPWRWLIGPIGAQAIMLLMVPSNADVFFYAISGDIANSGLNPYTTHLYNVPGNPLYPYNHWIDMSTVYGPVWTAMDRTVIAVSGNDPASAAMAFKLLFGVVAIALALGVFHVARMLGAGPGRATAAMVLVAWQPNVIVEAAGQAHNDVAMIALVLAGVALVAAGGSRTVRGGVVLVTLSALVKYVSLPVLGLLALVRLDRRREPGARWRIPLAWLLDGVAFLAVAIAAFAPYWTGPSVLAEMVSEPGRLYTNPIWFVPAWIIGILNESGGSIFEAVTRALAQIAAIIAILIVLAQFAMVVWNAPPRPNATVLPMWTRPLLASWAAIFTILAFVPVNTHPWYWTWPVVPIALFLTTDNDDSPSRWPTYRWLAPWLVLTAVLTLIYHTRIVHLG